MTFEEILDHALAMLQRRGRVTYRTLQLQFTLDDTQLAALKDELLYSQPHVVDDAGLSHYRRHHCGYCVGAGFPPSWTGGNSVTGLRADSDLEIKTGMSFHILSWLMETGKGNDFISNTVLLTETGAEVLTRTPQGWIIR